MSVYFSANAVDKVRNKTKISEFCNSIKGFSVSFALEIYLFLYILFNDKTFEYFLCWKIIKIKAC